MKQERRICKICGASSVCDKNEPLGFAYHKEWHPILRNKRELKIYLHKKYIDILNPIVEVVK